MPLWRCLIASLALGIAVVGCRNPTPDLKPPPEPEAFVLPPNTPRYNNPPSYPSDVLHGDPRAKQKSGFPGARGPGRTPGPPVGGSGPR